MEWGVIAIFSIIVGVLSQRKVSNRFGILLPFVIVTLLVSLHIAYKLYFYEYSGGGASLWPVVLVFQSFFGGFVGIFAYFASQSLFGVSKKLQNIN